MVRIPRQCPAAGAASEGEQNSRNDNENDTTPFPFGAVRRAEFDFSLLPDTISPSIESSSANQEIHDASFTPPKPTLIPSLSITPSEPVSKRMCTPGITNQQDDTIINHLHAQLEGLDISGARSNLDMANMSHALQEVMTGRDSRSAPLHDQFSFASVSPSPGLSAHRRRSGSRNTLEKHDVRDEAPPNDRFNILAVQNSLRNTKRLMSELVGVLASSAVHDEPDSVMKSLHRQAYELSDFNCQSTRTVGFVGDSGAGKSSLLNSLLDYQDLARSSNSGGACTCVVTEFHFHEDVELALTVERFSEAEILLQLENLLRDYRHFNLNRSSIDSHEAVDLEKRAEVASDTFRVMFPVSFVVDKDTLIRDTASNALSTIKSWMQDVDGLAIPKRLSGLSATQCSMSLMELSSVTTSRRAAVWPWIKKIKVYLNAHILSKGLVLVDLPGLRDLNSARRNITERYLLKCDEIFVVASEGRVTTDEGVRSVVELANKARLSNIGIICTRSDEIKATEARKDWKGKMAAMKIQQKTEAIEQDISEIKELEDEISSFYDIDNDDLTQEEVNELDLLHRKVRTTKGRLAGHQFDLKKFLITTRNADVEKKLVQLYKDEVPGDHLKVFCASNTVYWDNRKTPRDEAMPYLVLSGILAIREYCMTLVSESQYTAAAKYMRNDVQVLLGKLDLWVQSGQGSLSAERKAKIRSTLDTLERKLKMDLCGHTSVLRDIANFHKNEFNTKIYRPQSNHTGRWGTAARAASDDWSCWSHQTYAAFCRNYGTHRTTAVGSRSWNQEIVKEMANDISQPWEQLQLSLEQFGEDVIASIDNVFDWTDQFLGTELKDSQDTVFPLVSTLISQQLVLESEVETVLSDLQGDLRTLRTDALSGIRTSFIGKRMENAYNNARCQSGRGSDACRKAIINSAVNQNGLFADLLRNFRKDFNEHVKNAQDRIHEAVESNLGAIQDTLDIIRSDNIALESEKDPEFRERVTVALETTKQEMERLRSVLAA